MESEFIAYVGSPDIHDGTISNFEYQGDKASVTIKTYDKKTLLVEFDGVKSIKENKPVGMMLYSLSEMKHPDYRRFIFTNWEEEDGAYLEIIAENFKVYDLWYL